MDMKKILQAVDGTSTKPVEGSNDMKRFLQVMEGKGPLNRLTTAESMAVQTYSQETKKTITNPVLNIEVGAKPGMIGKYFKQVETEIAEAQERTKDRARQLAEIVSDQINEGVPRLSKHISQSKLPPDSLNRRAKKTAGKRLNVKETPIEMDPQNPNDPMIYGHEKANPMTLKGRIQQARTQLKELANMAESDDLAVWEQICKLAKGGMFMGLDQNMEQIRHGIQELAAKRKKGGVSSRGIDKNIG